VGGGDGQDKVGRGLGGLLDGLVRDFGHSRRGWPEMKRICCCLMARVGKLTWVIERGIVFKGWGFREDVRPAERGRTRTRKKLGGVD